MEKEAIIKCLVGTQSKEYRNLNKPSKINVLCYNGDYNVYKLGI